MGDLALNTSPSVSALGMASAAGAARALAMRRVSGRRSFMVAGLLWLVVGRVLREDVALVMANKSRCCETRRVVVRCGVGEFISQLGRNMEVHVWSRNAEQTATVALRLRRSQSECPSP